jgi:hypothetical protein
LFVARLPNAYLRKSRQSNNSKKCLKNMAHPTRGPAS